ncbi:MAG TPA: hypothetical protein ENJ51_01595 [Leucothrix mucor]|uniref:Uncharacterized protein n=1 Tax=Leucothrix mucor TaxID=45248 RepID=A0A7V2SYR4_LEUMU|nr:hypothetical protein [Leucothrix mucor]
MNTQGTPRKDTEHPLRTLRLCERTIFGYQLKAEQVTSWQITRTLRQAQGTSPSVDSGHRPFGRLRTPPLR